MAGDRYVNVLTRKSWPMRFWNRTLWTESFYTNSLQIVSVSSWIVNIKIYRWRNTWTIVFGEIVGITAKLNVISKMFTNKPWILKNNYHYSASRIYEHVCNAKTFNLMSIFTHDHV